MRSGNHRPLLFGLVFPFTLLAAVFAIGCNTDPDVFELDRYDVQTIAEHEGLRVELDILLFRPGFDVTDEGGARIGDERGASGQPTVRVEGTIINNGATAATVVFSRSVNGQTTHPRVLLAVNQGAPTEGRFWIDGAEFIQIPEDRPEIEYFKLPPGTEFPLTIHVPMDRFEEINNADLIFEEVGGEDLSGTSPFAVEQITPSSPTKESFDPFTVGW